jgi:hypothetical protein
MRLREHLSLEVRSCSWRPTHGTGADNEMSADVALDAMWFIFSRLLCVLLGIAVGWSDLEEVLKA